MLGEERVKIKQLKKRLANTNTHRYDYIVHDSLNMNIAIINKVLHMNNQIDALSLIFDASRLIIHSHRGFSSNHPTWKVQGAGEREREREMGKLGLVK